MNEGARSSRPRLVTRPGPPVELWVTETSLPARNLYEGLGFSASGEEQPLPSDTPTERGPNWSGAGAADRGLR